MVGCANLPARDVTDTSLQVSVLESSLYQSIEELGRKYRGDSGFELLTEGMDALAVRLRLISAAQVSLDVQYYIWHDDLVGRVMANRLLQAAERGVHVRVLLDDLDTSGKDEPLSILAQHPNIEVRLFNPFPTRTFRWTNFIRDGKRLNRRMHNKSITADGAITVVGGRNIGDEYFDASQSVRFADIDVLAIGPVALKVRAAFKRYWDSKYSYPIDQLVDAPTDKAKALADFKERSDANYQEALQSEYAEAVQARWDIVGRIDASHQVNWGDWKLFIDEPEKIDGGEIDAETHVAPHLINLLAEADKEILLISPYFVPGDAFTQFLIEKVATGKSVKIMTNSMAANDVTAVHGGYSQYRKSLVEGGVELYEFKPTTDEAEESKVNLSWLGSTRSSLHGKYLILDKEKIFVGSFNMDPRSVALNTEMGILYSDEDTAAEFSRSFDEYARQVAYQIQLNDGELSWHTIEDGQVRVYDTEPRTSWWDRFLLNVVSILVPESQL